MKNFGDRHFENQMPELGDRSLLFLHTPKTAGTSFKDLLERRFGSESSISVGLDATQGVILSLINADKYRFVHGHFPYDVVNMFSKRPFLFTMLREPVDRAISAFQYMKQQSSSMQRRAVAGQISKERAEDYAKAHSLTLSEFVRREPRAAARHLGNLQVEFLTSEDLEKRHRYDENYEIAVTAKQLDLAMERLSTFDAFGLVERLPEAKEYLAYALQTRPFDQLAWSNRTRSRPAVEEIDPDTLEALRKLTYYDGKLYAFAAELFERRRRAMLHKPLTLPVGHANLSSSFTSGMPIPGEGWYAAESDGKRRFNWTGPTSESWIELGAPDGADCELQIRVLHVLKRESLSDLQLLVNDVQLKPKVSRNLVGYTISARAPASVLRGEGKSNRVALGVSYLTRPCDCDPANNDSRMLGIAVASIALIPVSDHFSSSKPMQVFMGALRRWMA